MIFCKLHISSRQIGNHSQLSADESIPVASPALGSAKLATKMHTNFWYPLPLYVSHYLTRAEMKTPSFTVIGDDSEDGLSEDAAGELYLASIQSWT